MRTGEYTVETFSSPATFLARKPHYGPACLIIDLKMPEMNGIAVQSALVAAGDDIPVIFLSGEPDIASTVLAMKKGAVDFLVKPVAADVMMQCVQNCIAEHRKKLKRMIGRRELVFRFARLTAREREVAMLVGEGLPNKQIALQLGTAEKTVKHHRARAMVKLGSSPSLSSSGCWTESTLRDNFPPLDVSGCEWVRRRLESGKLCCVCRNNRCIRRTISPALLSCSTISCNAASSSMRSGCADRRMYSAASAFAATAARGSASISWAREAARSSMLPVRTRRSILRTL